MSNWLHNLAVSIATGRSPEQLYDDAAAGASAVPYDKRNADKAAHALAAEQMARRFGPTAASYTGLAKEGVQGLASLLTGGDFYGELAMSEGDLAANEAGINRVREEQERNAVAQAEAAREMARQALLARYGGTALSLGSMRPMDSRMASR